MLIDTYYIRRILKGNLSRVKFSVQMVQEKRNSFIKIQWLGGPGIHEVKEVLKARGVQAYQYGRYTRVELVHKYHTMIDVLS